MVYGKMIQSELQIFTRMKNTNQQGRREYLVCLKMIQAKLLVFTRMKNVESTKEGDSTKSKCDQEDHEMLRNVSS